MGTSTVPYSATTLRLNSEGRMRWLCERTLQSARADGQLAQSLSSRRAGWRTGWRSGWRTEERLKQVVAQQVARTNAKLEEMSSMIAQLVALQGDSAATWRPTRS
jgi:hypothetical protein